MSIHRPQSNLYQISRTASYLFKRPQCLKEDHLPSMETDLFCQGGRQRICSRINTNEVELKQFESRLLPHQIGIIRTSYYLLPSPTHFLTCEKQAYNLLRTLFACVCVKKKKVYKMSNMKPHKDQFAYLEANPKSLSK